MADLLTDRNGVICRGCFRTIDLTKLKRSEAPKWVKILRKITDEPTHFTVVCPHCKQKRTYSYKDDVKPISDFKERINQVYKEKEETEQFSPWENEN
jgi:hypothetical protein